ncbi:unnamed protein product [Rangifer tarandus platyrhynchus]|uniref:Uncharacterized protein n=2 Tax=Rangifer tarandus platyrhynchus TaxID=3082113 RepID=A0ABN8ZBI6_RANTA|nr:unnamed protein product [Rangifer tarandus platyrhynchus]CAI9705832.1 unnamed protein product [Rangifer tarandus platyrhynchus]
MTASYHSVARFRDAPYSLAAVGYSDVFLKSRHNFGFPDTYSTKRLGAPRTRTTGSGRCADKLTTVLQAAPSHSRASPNLAIPYPSRRFAVQTVQRTWNLLNSCARALWPLTSRFRPSLVTPFSLGSSPPPRHANHHFFPGATSQQASDWLILCERHRKAVTIGWEPVAAFPQDARKVIGRHRYPISGGLSDSNLARSAYGRLVSVESLLSPDADVPSPAPCLRAASL